MLNKIVECGKKFKDGRSRWRWVFVSTQVNDDPGDIAQKG